MRTSAWLGLVLAIGCSSPATAPDAGGEDGGVVRDAGSFDAGASDAGASDAGASDASIDASSDAGPMGCAPAPASGTVLTVTDAPYGAVGDGTTDDTAAIQRALDALGVAGGTVLVPDGTYLVDATRALRPGSGTTLRLSPGAVLRAMPTADANYDVVRIDHVHDVAVVGGTIEGERGAHTGTGGEWGMGLSIHASMRVVIDGVTARECWGDGFYVTGASSDVTMCNVLADHNRRQGMSITAVTHMQVRDSVFQHTGGTLPEDGVDIEPNAGESVDDVSFVRCRFVDNAGYGLEDGVPIASTGMASITNVTVDACEAAGNGVGTLSTSGRAGFTISNASGLSITNSRSHDNTADGIYLRNDANGTTITGNTITHNMGSGIVEYLCMNNTITGNTVTDNTGHGIYSPSSTGSTISGNTVSGNGMMP